MLTEVLDPSKARIEGYQIFFLEHDSALVCITLKYQRLQAARITRWPMRKVLIDSGGDN